MTAAHPIGCREAVARLWDLLDGEVDAAERAALDQHLAFCVQCCGELAFAEELRSMLHHRTEVAVPGDVHDRLERFVDHLPDPTESGDLGPA